MVKRILHFIHKEIGSVHQAAYLLGFCAFLSQLLALVRDRLFAYHFGATQTLDFYYAAFRIPDFLFVTAASIVSISVLVPFLLEYMEKGREEAKRFLDDVFSFFVIFMGVVAVVAAVLTPAILRHLFPAFASLDTFGDLIMLSRILILSPVCLGFSNLLASVTNIEKRFFVYALSPILYNVGIICGLIVFYPMFGLFGLGLGVVCGAILHFAIQIPSIYSSGLFPRWSWPLNMDVVKRIVYTSIPRTITVSSNELAELFLISFASFLVPGSITIFNLSFNLQSVPFSIIGVSYSIAAFPMLAKLFSSGNSKGFIDHMVTTSRHVIFWSVPISTLFIVLRAQIVRVILGSGEFNWNDTRLTAAALAIFTISLIAQNMTTLFVRAYYARGKTRAPLLMNMFSASFIVGFSYVLVRVFQTDFFFRNFIEAIFKVSSVPGTVVLMLPLGFSIGVLMNMIIHWIGFAVEFPGYSRTVLRTLFESFSASVIMGFVTYRLLVFGGLHLTLSTFSGIFLQGLLAGIGGIIAGVLILYILDSRELTEVWTTLHKKIWKTKVIGPDAQLL